MVLPHVVVVKKIAFLRRVTATSWVIHEQKKASAALSLESAGDAFVQNLYIVSD